MEADIPWRCPVCRAPFRETTTCSRCGADLGPLMTVLIQAWSLRQQSREAIRAGDYVRAAQLASAADQTHSTRLSQRLSRLTRFLAAGKVDAPMALM